MNTTTTLTPPEKTVLHTFALTVAIPEDWIRYVTRSGRLFRWTFGIGYWARAIEQDEELGHLVWNDDQKHRIGDEPHVEAALTAWRAGEKLPADYHRFDRAFALRAFEEGVKRWGVNWWENGDATSEDVAIQLAIFGEVKYG